MKKTRNFFLKQDGYKEVWDMGKAALVSVPIVLIGASTLFVDFLKRPDTSFVVLRGGGAADYGKSAVEEADLPGVSSALTAGVLDDTRVRRTPVSRRAVKPKRRIKYRARQVISRRESMGVGLPVGTRFKGVLVTGIDTRFPRQMIRAALPEGAHWKGERRLEKGASLFGTFHHKGRNERVFLRFTRGVTPDGREFALSAQALDAGDSSPGIAGVFHGNADGRIASALGLSAATGMAEALTRKDYQGQIGQATVRSTLRDALLHGATRAGEAEVERKMEGIARSPEYVTVAAGTELTVMLTETWKGGGNGRQ